VLIPGLIPEFPAAFPHTGRGRAQQAAVRLGWQTTPLAEADLNLMPIPYA
jgi:ribosomal protein S12 methylthiotransferase accessory factor